MTRLSIRALVAALTASALLISTTASGMAAMAPSPAARALRDTVAPGQQSDAVIQAAIDAEIDAAIDDPAYTRLRALVSSGLLPSAARSAMSRVLVAGVRRAAPGAPACRELTRSTRDADGALAGRCRLWLDAHADGPLAQAACARVLQTIALPTSLDPLVPRCGDVIARYASSDDGTLRAICERVDLGDAVAERSARLAARCRAVGNRIDESDANRLAVCVRLARFAIDQPGVIDRCRALLTGEDMSANRSLRATLSAAIDIHVGAETKGRGPTIPDAAPRSGRATTRDGASGVAAGPSSARSGRGTSLARTSVR